MNSVGSQKSGKTHTETHTHAHKHTHTQTHTQRHDLQQFAQQRCCSHRINKISFAGSVMFGWQQIRCRGTLTKRACTGRSLSSLLMGATIVKYN